jgi:hypothetical protein
MTKRALVSIASLFLVLVMFFFSSTNAAAKELTVWGTVQLSDSVVLLVSGGEEYVLEGIDLSEYEGQMLIVTGNVELLTVETENANETYAIIHVEDYIVVGEEGTRV